MKKILDRLRGYPKRYAFLKKIYGYTLGFWWLKTLYLRYIGIWNGEKRLKLLNIRKSDKILSKKIKKNKPFMLARYGSSEFRAIMNDEDFPLVCFYSGFFPQDIELLKKFRDVYLKSTQFIDMMVVWNYRNHFFKEIKLIKKFSNIVYIGEGPSLPAKGWQKSLKNKKILVIHPFKSTIEKQIKKRKQLGILPKLKSLEVIRAVQTIAGNADPRFKDWFEALEWMKKEIDKKDFDIAIIGCGAYGLPLAAHVKSKGKQALHLAGGTQLLFGIKGKRWDENPEIIYTKDWIYPLPEDTPKDFKKIEGGCYW
ncbi:hypothetical protein K9L16_03310 [Candidatus Pacearchaeota archaeon]|nr:hypothetical protein [Candidatus Pacearchaeota archaeon]